MHFEETDLFGVWLVDREPFRDARGSFARTFCADTFRLHGLASVMVQTNLSCSRRRHTLRGLHYQTDGAEEAKLVQCLQGSILDVVLDVRPASPTFGRHVMVRLAGDGDRMIYVPEGCAHGFLTLEDECRVLYQVSHAYAPGHERGIRWDDPWHGIPWPAEQPVLSEKDRCWPDFLPAPVTSGTT